MKRVSMKASRSTLLWPWSDEEWSVMNSPEEIIHESSGKPHEDHAKHIHEVQAPPPPTPEQEEMIRRAVARRQELMARVHAMRTPKDLNERFLMAREARIRELAKNRDAISPFKTPLTQRQVAAEMARGLPKRSSEDLLRLKAWKAIPDDQKIELVASWRFWWRNSGRPMSECPPFPS